MQCKRIHLYSATVWGWGWVGPIFLGGVCRNVITQQIKKNVRIIFEKKQPLNEKINKSQFHQHFVHIASI